MPSGGDDFVDSHEPSEDELVTDLLVAGDSTSPASIERSPSRSSSLLWQMNVRVMSWSFRWTASTRANGPHAAVLAGLRTLANWCSICGVQRRHELIILARSMAAMAPNQLALRRRKPSGCRGTRGAPGPPRRPGGRATSPHRQRGRRRPRGHNGQSVPVEQALRVVVVGSGVSGVVVGTVGLRSQATTARCRERPRHRASRLPHHGSAAPSRPRVPRTAKVAVAIQVFGFSRRWISFQSSCRSSDHSDDVIVIAVALRYAPPVVSRRVGGGMASGRANPQSASRSPVTVTSRN